MIKHWPISNIWLCFRSETNWLNICPHAICGYMANLTDCGRGEGEVRSAKVEVEMQNRKTLTVGSKP